MRRNLILNDEDLIMVVKEDVVKQIDEHRGEMTRTEFVTHLIQYQLKECYQQKNYVTREEFQQFTQEITELLHNFLQFFVSYGMALGRMPGQPYQAQSQPSGPPDKPAEPFSGPDRETEEP
jgi:hypothetical protein